MCEGTEVREYVTVEGNGTWVLLQKSGDAEWSLGVHRPSIPASSSKAFAVGAGQWNSAVHSLAGAARIPALPGQLVAEVVLLKAPLGADSAGCSLGGPVCCVSEESFLEALLSPFLQLSHSSSDYLIQ